MVIKIITGLLSKRKPGFNLPADCLPTPIEVSSSAASRETVKKTLGNAKIKEFKLEKANTKAGNRESSLNPTEVYDNN